MTPFTAEMYLEFIGLGFAVGAYGTLIGAGGGFVLMPLLLLLYPSETPEKLTAISLAIVFLNALSGSQAYARMKRIDYKSGLLFASATIPGAIVGAIYTTMVPRRLFDAVFAVFLIAGAVFLAFRPELAPIKGDAPQNHHGMTMNRRLKEGNGTTFDYSFNPLVGVIISLFVGYISSFLGIGGGIMNVIILVYILHFPIHVATATSQFMLLIMALTASIVHLVLGSFSGGLHHLISLAIGVVLGAQLGAHLSNFLKGKWIIRSLAIALGIVGVRIIISVIQRAV
jgi:uncharacterized protein